MTRNEAYEDVAFLLLLVPFIGSGVYALFLWAGFGVSLLFPEQAYLGVTRNPDIFLIGTFAILISVVLEISSESPEKRTERTLSVSRRLQRLAAASFILAILAAWYANGFSLDLGGTFLDLLSGRYTLVFPAILILLSFLIITPTRLRSLSNFRTVAVILLLSVPAVIYLVGRRSPAIGLLVSLLLTISAALILSWSGGTKRNSTAQ